MTGLPNEHPPSAPAPAAGQHLGTIIDRHPHLIALRKALAADIGIRIRRHRTAAGSWALDLCTLCTAIWYTAVTRADVHHQALGQLADLLRVAVAKLSGAAGPTPAPEISTWRDRVACAEAQFYALIDSQSGFRAAARGYFHVPEKYKPAVAGALTLPPSMGGAKWQAAHHPIGLVRKKAQIFHAVDDLYHGGGEIPERDALFPGKAGAENRGVVPILRKNEIDRDGPRYGDFTLEELVEMPGEVPGESTYTKRSLAQLKRDVQKDVEVAQYLDAWLTVGNTGNRIKAIRNALGWTKARVLRVDRRYRRLRNTLLETEEVAEKDHVATDAGHTWFKEVLFGGQRGAGVGAFVYQHAPQPVEWPALSISKH
jgi:hypothetical protein